MKFLSNFSDWELNEKKKHKKKKKHHHSSGGTKVYNNYYNRGFGGLGYGLGYGLSPYAQFNHDNTPDITNNINITNTAGGGDTTGGDAGDSGASN